MNKKLIPSLVLSAFLAVGCLAGCGGVSTSSKSIGSSAPQTLELNDDDYDSAAEESNGVNGIPTQSNKLSYNSYITFLSDNVSEDMTKLMSLTDEYDGEIISHEEDSNTYEVVSIEGHRDREFTHSASIIVEVPNDKTLEFNTAVSKLGEVTSVETYGEQPQGDYSDDEIKRVEKEIERIKKDLESDPDNENLKSQLKEYENFLEEMKSSKEEAKKSTLMITVIDKKSEISPMTSAGVIVEESIYALGMLLASIAGVLVFIVPIAAVAMIIVFIVRAIKKNKRKKSQVQQEQFNQDNTNQKHHVNSQMHMQQNVDTQQNSDQNQTKDINNNS